MCLNKLMEHTSSSCSSNKIDRQERIEMKSKKMMLENEKVFDEI